MGKTATALMWRVKARWIPIGCWPGCILNRDRGHTSRPEDDAGDRGGGHDRVEAVLRARLPEPGPDHDAETADRDPPEMARQPPVAGQRALLDEYEYDGIRPARGRDLRDLLPARDRHGKLVKDFGREHSDGRSGAPRGSPSWSRMERLARRTARGAAGPLMRAGAARRGPCSVTSWFPMARDMPRPAPASLPTTRATARRRYTSGLRQPDLRRPRTTGRDALPEAMVEVSVGPAFLSGSRTTPRALLLGP
jgi:hypothetical protein